MKISAPKRVESTHELVSAPKRVESTHELVELSRVKSNSNQ
jgi:hypothetical protein